MTNEHIKKCSTSLAIKEMQVKTILRFHFTPVRMAIIKNTTKNIGEDVKKNTLCTVFGNVNLYNHYVFEVPQKTKTRVSIRSSDATLGHMSKVL
jgi:hypothetical protein